MQRRRKQLTLISVKAKFLPRHILGPNPNVSRCLYPWISADLAPAASSDSFNHRFGLNWAASAPHSASDLLTPTTGIRMLVPLGTKMVEVKSPDAVRMGCVSGIVSSSWLYDAIQIRDVRTPVFKECGFRVESRLTSLVNSCKWGCNLSTSHVNASR